MRKQASIAILLFCLGFLPLKAMADPITLKADDTVQSVLNANLGKRVTVMLKSGQELSGKVATVTAQVTHINQLTGKEFYDAVVATKSIIAVVVRVK